MNTNRIRLITHVYGAWTGKPGDEVERPEVEARRLIAGGHAVLVEAPAATESAQTSEGK